MELNGLLLNNINELNKYNLRLADKDIPVTNNIKAILNKKGLSTSDLGRMTGISRQNLSAIYNSKFKPGIDSVLKIAYVLNVTVDELFKLKETAWVKKNEETLYIDMLNLEIINITTQKIKFKNDKIKYIEKELKSNRKLLTATEYTMALKGYILENYADTEKIITKKNTKISEKSLNSLIKSTLEEQFELIYIERFQKLVEYIFPIVNLK